MRVRCVLTAIAMLLLSLPASAQTRTLTGTVTDASTGQPLEGARITVRGTSLATTTGASGQFTLGGLPNGGITVSIRRIGNNPVEIVLAPSQNSISVTLTRDPLRLSDVVVTGQATGVERRNLANAVATVSGEEVSRGDVGVMWVRGDSVAMGYHGDRDKSWETFHGAWCRTGDLFRRDEAGYLWFCGRADSLFKVGGVFVAPLEIEECLMEHDVVAMAAVIPAEEAGLVKPKAFVALRDGVSADDAGARERLCVALQEHVKARLSKHKYPRWVVFVDDLPKNDRGKVDKKVLIERERAGENPWR